MHLMASQSCQTDLTVLYVAVSFVTSLFKGTTNVIFIFSQFQEQYIARKGVLLLCFDLEKTFDRVPRAGVKWGMRKLAIGKCLVRVVVAMYEVRQTKGR